MVYMDGRAPVSREILYGRGPNSSRGQAGKFAKCGPGEPSVGPIPPGEAACNAPATPPGTAMIPKEVMLTPY